MHLMKKGYNLFQITFVSTPTSVKKLETYLISINQKNTEMKMKKIEVKMEQKGLSMEINKQEFALALKTWRLRNDLTQKKVAEMWGCSRFTIMRAELAKDITWEMAYRLFAKLSEELRKESSHEVYDNH